MKILITGSTGFLGQSLTARLKSLQHEVVALSSRNCDLTDRHSLDAYSQEKYDVVYHLAAWTQAGDFCIYHPGEQWVINQEINTSVLDWWHKHQGQAKLVTIGTSCAYSPDLPLVEENYLTGEPIESLYTYAMTKRMMYVGLLALRKQYGLNYLQVVPSTLYGPGYHTDGRQMHFIFDLIRKVLRGKLLGEPVVLWGDGHQSRELVYVNDFVDILVQLVEKVDNELVNIGAGEEFSIRHFAQLICQHVGFDFGQIQFDTSRYVGSRSKCLCTDKLQGLLPELNLTPLQQGLAATIDWLRDQDCILGVRRAG